MLPTSNGSQAAEGVDGESRHQQRRDHRRLRQQRTQPGSRHRGAEHRDVQRLGGGSERTTPAPGPPGTGKNGRSTRGNGWKKLGKGGTWGKLVGTIDGKNMYNLENALETCRRYLESSWRNLEQHETSYCMLLPRIIVPKNMATSMASRHLIGTERRWLQWGSKVRRSSMGSCSFLERHFVAPDGKVILRALFGAWKWRCENLATTNFVHFSNEKHILDADTHYRWNLYIYNIRGKQLAKKRQRHILSYSHSTNQT